MLAFGVSRRQQAKIKLYRGHYKRAHWYGNILGFGGHFGSHLGFMPMRKNPVSYKKYFI
jgi:hypothetical protein